ncbi:hypothetical protein HX775_02735 [Serratia proteamaculans]|uniref:hypothetical protein n=1 Tax=Serratia proteamaculans TaxID=28151 RepID=UPI0015A296F3|nr:hypothetical protein [Serratia proteamaculans]NWA70833.1 hypothetical protein [Serratia proteamaculans]
MSILTTVGISFFTAWITMRLALHRFYREKWWDKKATAYLELIDVLYDFKEDYGTMQDHEFSKGFSNNNGEPYDSKDTLSSEDEAIIWKRISITRGKLEKLKGLGPLIYTEIALEKISEFIKRDYEVSQMAHGDEIDNFDAYGEIRKSAEDLYKEFKVIAEFELKLKTGFKVFFETTIKWMITQYIRAEDEYLKNTPPFCCKYKNKSKLFTNDNIVEGSTGRVD